MKYSEASKLIQKLSDDYSINLITENSVVGFLAGYNVYYKGELVVYVSTNTMYGIYPANVYLYKLPSGNKLWMILSELAMTKPSERLSEPKYNVIIANVGFNINTVWYKLDQFFPYDVDTIDDDDLVMNKYIFTEEEYKELIQYIKTLPDGEYQAKVAEHGKTLIKEED
ncbi:hypothetical protein [Levilactobacillus phage ENFP1]|nr:hypothetical protein [Levilactobacillus phage ENFP1]